METLVGLSETHLCGPVAARELGASVHKEVVAPFLALRQDAAQAGFDLRIFSGFRNFQHQLSIWNRKAEGKLPVLDSKGSPLDIHGLSQKALVFAILRWSALPGASRHHWGTDLDVIDEAARPQGYEVELIPDEVDSGGMFGPLHDWLDGRIEAFDAHGFFRPYDRDRGGVAPERWHLSHEPVARDLEDITREADWFSDHRIEFIFCCDANFSLLPRDLDIIRCVAANKAQRGYPQALSVQSTKNFTDTSYAIYALMGEAGLSKGVSLSLQSVHPATLTAIRRQNIAAETFREAQHRLSAMGIETFTDIILPLPEETLDSFIDGVCATIGNGQHNRIQFNNLSILPNALMGDPAYQDRYGFEMVETDIVNIHGQVSHHPALLEKQRLVIGTASMPREDWVQARVFYGTFTGFNDQVVK